MGQKRNARRNTPLARLASILAGIVLVLSLMPVQGLAEARDEVIDLTVTEAQEGQANDSGTAPSAEQEGQDEVAVVDGADDGQAAQQGEEQGPAEGEEASAPAVTEQGGGSASSTTTGSTAGATSQSTSKPAQSPTKPARQLSAKLSDFLDQAEILGAKETDDAIVVNEGAVYNVRLTFVEGTDSKEFAEMGELTFALPSSFVASANQPAAKKALVASYADANGERHTIELDKNSWWVRGNVIHLVWRARDAANRSKVDVAKDMRSFFALANVEFDLTVAGTFSKRANAIDFGAGEMALEVVPAKKQVAKKTEQKKQSAPTANASQAQAQDDQMVEGEQDPNEVAEAPTTEFVYEDDQVYVTATTTKAGAIPEDASLEVSRVRGRSADLYLTALNASSASSSEYDAHNTLLYDVAFFQDGEEVQPTEGNVRVSFTFKQDQLSGELGAQEGGCVEVNHLPMVKGAPSVEPVGANVCVEEGTADFATKSFSVYSFSYTVDFTYGDHFFSMPGKGSVMLSSLFVSLGIDRSVADVASVTFTNPELLSVTKELVGSDWRLVSLQSFDSFETLRVVMKNGDVIEVAVTDPETFDPDKHFLDISVQKKWVGADNVEDSEKDLGLRPDSVTIKPYKEKSQLADSEHVWVKNASGEYEDTGHNYITLTKQTDGTWPAVTVALPKPTTDDGAGVKAVYTFEEDAVVSYAGTCAWDADPSTSVTVTNKLQTGTLNVTKKVAAGYKSEEYLTAAEQTAIAEETSFIVTGPGVSETKKLSDFSDPNTEGERMWSLGTVPAGEYTITETGKNRDGWTITRTAQYVTDTTTVTSSPTTDETVTLKPTVEDSKTTTASFTNTYTYNKVGELEIIKAVTVDGKPTKTTAADGTYSFVVAGVDESNKDVKKEVSITVTNGTAAAVVVDGLPTGKYVLTEQTPTNGTKLVGDNNVKLTVSGYDAVVRPSHTFTNNKVASTTAKLSVTKQVVGEGYTGNEAFEFKLAKPLGDITSDVLPSDPTVKVKAGKTGEFGEITYTEPGWYVYTITEVKPSDPTNGMTYDTTAKYAYVKVDEDFNVEISYSPSLDTSSYKDLSGDDLVKKLKEDLEKATLTTSEKLTVTNYYSGGKLSVYKVVVSTRSEDKSRSYGFKVTLDDKTISGTYGGMTFKDGVATFTLKGGENKKAIGLPIGSSGLLKYTVTETDSGGLTSNMGSPIKSANGNEHIVTCTNTYKAPGTTTSGTASTTSGTTLATTSDSTNVVAPIVLLAIGAVGVVGGVLYRKRKQQ